MVHTSASIVQMPVSPPTPRHDGAVELYRRARVKMRPALDAYGRTLLGSLESDNPYERRPALERLQAKLTIVDEHWVPALVRRLVETTPLFDEHCAAVVERLDRSYRQVGETTTMHALLQGMPPIPLLVPRSHSSPTLPSTLPSPQKCG
jgi:hypothetical protein